MWHDRNVRSRAGESVFKMIPKEFKCVSVFSISAKTGLVKADFRDSGQIAGKTIAAFRFRGEMEISSRKAERFRGKKLPFANTAACVVTTGKGAIRSMPEKDAVPALPERAE